MIPALQGSHSDHFASEQDFKKQLHDSTQSSQAASLPHGLCGHTVHY